ncbi:MAG: membrane protein required for colicin V production [Roseivirga sp.]|jgi:membrane protein required for colicin V production
MGFRKGLLLEIIGILAFILAIIGGFKLMQIGITYLQTRIEGMDHWLPFISFIVIFIAIILLVTMLGKALKKLLDLTLLGGFDNFAGAIIGILKWAIGVSIVLWVLANFGFILPGQDEDLILYPYLASLGPNLIESLNFVLPFAEEMLVSIKEMLSPHIP